MVSYNERSDMPGVEKSTVASVAAMAVNAGDQIAEVAGQAKEVASEQFDRLAETIRRRPLQATGIAAGIGFVLAMLARR